MNVITSHTRDFIHRFRGYDSRRFVMLFYLQWVPLHYKVQAYRLCRLIVNKLIIPYFNNQLRRQHRYVYSVGSSTKPAYFITTSVLGTILFEIDTNKTNYELKHNFKRKNFVLTINNNYFCNRFIKEQITCKSVCSVFITTTPLLLVQKP